MQKHTELQKMKEMFALQARLNDDTNGPDWRKGVTAQGKVVNWRRCIVMEAAELIDSLPWKHWKSIAGEIDLANIRIEIVDIWHFVMSEVLRVCDPAEGAAKALAHRRSCEVRLPTEWNKEADRMLDTLLAPFESLMALALTPEGHEDFHAELLGRFWAALNATGMETDALYRLYIGKNALNQFRQAHGYKAGTYVKVWQGREDNVVMQEILARNPDIGYEALLAALEEAYARALK